ncbi:MAG: D-alanyl-D-alanine carboxypeptidase [Chlamydiia bacterium]|nr:D-alanyl-D-alanine carboxypeptidase [Chlamydiia bacterium]
MLCLLVLLGIMRVFFGIFAFLFLCLSLRAKPLEVSVCVPTAILINAETGAVLFEKEANKPCFPASTTKIATALFAIKLMQGRENQLMRANYSALVSITPQAKKQSNYRSPPHLLETDGTHMSLKKGEELPFYELLSGMLVGSANDAANVIADNLGPTIPKFMERLNAYLKEIGCSHTHFLNPHGLHHPDHVTTASDLALMAQEAMKEPVFREIVAKSCHTCPQSNLEYIRYLRQTNLLLRRGVYFYPEAIGIKTGTTKAAGKTMVSAAQKEGRILIGVVLGATHNQERYGSTKALFDAAFSEKKKRRVFLKPGITPIKTKVAHGKGLLTTQLPHGLYYDFFPSEESPLIVKVSFETLIPPIGKGDVVGAVDIMDEQEIILKRTLLLSATDLKPTRLYQLTTIIKARRQPLFWVISVFFLLILTVFLSRKKRSSRSRPLF